MISCRRHSPSLGTARLLVNLLRAVPSRPLPPASPLRPLPRRRLFSSSPASIAAVPRSGSGTSTGIDKSWDAAAALRIGTTLLASPARATSSADTHARLLRAVSGAARAVRLYAKEPLLRLPPSAAIPRVRRGGRRPSAPERAASRRAAAAEAAERRLSHAYGVMLDLATRRAEGEGAPLHKSLYAEVCTAVADAAHAGRRDDGAGVAEDLLEVVSSAGRAGAECFPGSMPGSRGIAPPVFPYKATGGGAAGHAYDREVPDYYDGEEDGDFGTDTFVVGIADFPEISTAPAPTDQCYDFFKEAIVILTGNSRYGAVVRLIDGIEEEYGARIDAEGGARDTADKVSHVPYNLAISLLSVIRDRATVPPEEEGGVVTNDMLPRYGDQEASAVWSRTESENGAAHVPSAFFDDNEYADAMELIGMLKDSVREELRRKNDAIREQEEHLREMMEEMGFDADIDLDSESDGVEGEYRKDKGNGDGENIKATERIKSVDEILADMKRTMKEDEQDDGCDYRDEPHKQKSVDELLTDFKHTRDDDKDTADINGDDSDLQEPKKK